MTERLAWTCPKCSAWCWNHHQHCAACGAAKPAPAPAETPSDETRPEPPWRLAFLRWEIRRALNEQVTDAGKVRLGAFAPSLPTTT